MLICKHSYFLQNTNVRFQESSSEWQPRFCRRGTCLLCSLAWDLLDSKGKASSMRAPWSWISSLSLPRFSCSAICNSRIPLQSTHMGYLAIAVDRTQTQAKRRNVQAGQRIPLLTDSASWSHQCLSPLYISTFIWTVQTARVGMDPHLERDHSFVN